VACRPQEVPAGLVIILLIVGSLIEISSIGKIRHGVTLVQGRPIQPRLAFSKRPDVQQPTFCSWRRQESLMVRGGATTVNDDEEDEYNNDESDEDEEEEEVVAHLAKDDADQDVKDKGDKLDASLAAAAVLKSVKQKANTAKSKKDAVKKAVNSKLRKSNISSSTTTAALKKKKTSLLKILHVPYIVRVLFHPVTVFRMTSAYWKSLFDLNYGKQEASQELRSALEEKAKRGGGPASGGKGRRKMKRGQAKTLSDLPKLST